MHRWAFAFVTVIVFVGCSQNDTSRRAGSTSQPSPLREGLTWTHKDLHEYLESRGVHSHMLPAGNLDGDILASFVSTNEKGDATVFLKPTARAAKEHVAPYGQYGLAWGRFMLVTKVTSTEPRFLNSIKSALSAVAK